MLKKLFSKLFGTVEETAAELKNAVEDEVKEKRVDVQPTSVMKETPAPVEKSSHDEDEDDGSEDDIEDDDDLDTDDDDEDNDSESFIVTATDDNGRTVSAMVTHTQTAEFKSPLDPETYHGTHYKVEDFDTELEKRVAKAIKEEEEEEGTPVSKADVDNIRHNFTHELYIEWNLIRPEGRVMTTAETDALLNFDNRNSMKYYGIASVFTTEESQSDNPLLEPIHGVSLQDYAAVSYYMASGTDYHAIISQLGIDDAVWGEANTLWAKRMEEDQSMSVVVLFGQYYSSADQHPKLSAVKAEVSEKGQETLEKLKTDRHLFIELQAAQIAAFDSGLDGTKWLMDNYGVSLGDFQKIAGMYSEQDQKDVNLQQQDEDFKYREQKQQEYKEKFAREMGGNVADDINF